MRRYSEILKEKFYGKGWVHPYKIFEQKIFDYVQPNATILDVGKLELPIPELEWAMRLVRVKVRG